MDELLPVVRCPWRRQAGCSLESVRTMVVDDLMGVSGYELPKTVKFKSYKLGIFKLAVMLPTFVWYVLWNGMYVNKDYLRVFPVEGDIRLQLQHPVKSCNPLHDSCRANFRSFKDLPYCKQSGSKSDVKQELCENMDEYEVPAQAFPSSKILIPTRNTILRQKQLCEPTDEDCDNRYNLIGAPITRYSADVENFTLLVDHAMVCEGLGEEGMAWDLVGFVRPCGAPHDCELVALQPLSDKFQGGVDDKKHNNAKYFFDVKADIAKKEAYRLPNGDVFRVGYVLDMLGIDLDGTNDRGEVLREEGVVLMLEVHYTNFKHYTRPNKMPIVYEYRFTRAPFQTYKATETSRDIKGKERHIFDTHGIVISARQTGNISAFSLRDLLLMLLEASLLIGIVRWFVSFVSVNWWKGENGDRLEHMAEECVEVKVTDALEGTMELVLVGKLGRKLDDDNGVKVRTSLLYDGLNQAGQ